MCGKPDDLSGTSAFATVNFHQIWSRNVFRCPVAESGKTFKNFHFRRHLPPKSKIESRSNRHLTQSRLQVTGCTAERYCVLHVVCQGPEHFLYRSAFLYDVYTVAELRSFKVAQFSDFGLSSHTKPVKRIPSSDQPTAQELHRRMILIFHVIVEGPKGCLLAPEISCDFW